MSEEPTEKECKKPDAQQSNDYCFKICCSSGNRTPPEASRPPTPPEEGGYMVPVRSPAGAAASPAQEPGYVNMGGGPGPSGGTPQPTTPQRDSLDTNARAIMEESYAEYKGVKAKEEAEKARRAQWAAPREKKGVVNKGEIFRLQDFLSSVGVQGSYCQQTKSLFLCDTNPDEMRLLKYAFDGKSVKKAKESSWDDGKKPVSVTAEYSGSKVYVHVLAPQLMDSFMNAVFSQKAKCDEEVWTLNGESLELVDQIDTAPLGKKEPTMKWTMCADSGWLLVLSYDTASFGGDLHMYKKGKYSHSQKAQHSACKVAVRGKWLVMGSTQRKSVFLYTFDQGTGRMGDAVVWQCNEVQRGMFALVDTNLVTENPTTFSLRFTKLEDAANSSREQRMVRAMEPICGLQDQVYAVWDKLGRELRLMQIV